MLKCFILMCRYWIGLHQLGLIYLKNKFTGKSSSHFAYFWKVLGRYVLTIVMNLQLQNGWQLATFFPVPNSIGKSKNIHNYSYFKKLFTLSFLIPLKKKMFRLYKACGQVLKYNLTQVWKWNYNPVKLQCIQVIPILQIILA